jgi:hypothetical protein
MHDTVDEFVNQVGRMEKGLEVGCLAHRPTSPGLVHFPPPWAYRTQGGGR